MYKILTKIIARSITEISEETNLIEEVQGIGKLGISAYNEAKIIHNIIEDSRQHGKEVHISYIDI